LAASTRELAFRLLYIRRPGAGIRRLLTPGLKVGGLLEKACGDIWIRGGHCKLQKGCRLFRQVFFTRHNLVPRHDPLLSAVPEPITHRGGFRSAEQRKSSGLCPGWHAAGAASFLAEKFAGLLVDEMKPCTGQADDGRIGIGLVRRGLRKPMLHVGAQLRAFEKDMSAHSSE
jgi:hypothetical protein